MHHFRFTFSCTYRKRICLALVIWSRQCWAVVHEIIQQHMHMICCAYKFVCGRHSHTHTNTRANSPFGKRILAVAFVGPPEMFGRMKTQYFVGQLKITIERDCIRGGDGIHGCCFLCCFSRRSLAVLRLQKIIVRWEGGRATIRVWFCDMFTLYYYYVCDYENFTIETTQRAPDLFVGSLFGQQCFSSIQPISLYLSLTLSHYVSMRCSVSEP